MRLKGSEKVFKFIISEKSNSSTYGSRTVGGSKPPPCVDSSLTWVIDETIRTSQLTPHLLFL